MSPPSEPMLQRKDAARYLTQKFGFPVAPSTLAKLAVVGGGPEFRKVGRAVLYERGDLDSWGLVRIGPKLRSTSDGRD